MQEALEEVLSVAASAREGTVRLRESFSKIQGSIEVMTSSLVVIQAGADNVAHTSSELSLFAKEIAGKAEQMTHVAAEMALTAGSSRALMSSAGKHVVDSVQTVQ